MVRLIQFAILGLCIGALLLMWMSDTWVDVLRRPYYRSLYTLGILLFLFMVPAFGAVFSNEKVRPGERSEENRMLR